ncbi:fatty acyl-AMP ligase [Paractinoplanes hotanensis]|uniref:Fatty acyl-AMP ligase n=1 Tax=Paractinoplanes hotanensis TaxID=2906497 RepID=A0ABT0Y6G4_9ACTN|nr:fatty acyl-AMP ligase [Actinoplanes hotanensis]MCM4081435.1 fatty acyl-AMP ligase [Actinoplanes hotanensis]
MSDHETFVDLIQHRAASHPGRPALIFDPDPALSDGPVRTVTWADLAARARQIATLLAGPVRAGDRVLVLNEPGTAFAENFLGVQHAGAVPVPAPLPDGYRRQRDRLAGIARNAQVAAILTDAAALDVVRAWAAESALADVPCLAFDEVALDPAAEWERPPIDGSTIAFLQYTSGSTSTPKGVVVDHANLRHNLRTFHEILGGGEGERVGGWLPMYHDFGLIGQLLAPLSVGGCSVGMSATAFLKRPHTWLRLIDRHDIRISPAPNFAYDLCTRRVTDDQIAGLDLSRWAQAVNGSEPVQATTLAAFAHRFAGAGLRPEALCPGYGMAEATLSVSGAAEDRPPVVTTVDADLLERDTMVPVDAAHEGPVRHLVSSGGAPAGIDIRIVHPVTRRPQPADRIGEIWLRSDSVARGYWADPAATAEVFDNALADGEGGFLRTGDLGLLRDGELYVTGRIKELLIVNGRNLYPHDIEAAVRTVDDRLSRGVGAAFTVETPHEELVVVQECRARSMDPSARSEIVTAVRRLLSTEFGVGAASVVLVRPGAVPRTTSGKIQRGLARMLFLSETLGTEHEQLTAAVRDARAGRRADDRVRS